MIMTPIRSTNAPEQAKLDTLEDAAADLDTASTFCRIADVLLGSIRDFLRETGSPSATIVLREISDLDTLICEVKAKSDDAKHKIIAFHEAEFAARRSGKG